MIPKTIHYCWFGNNPKSELAIKCINSWKKYCPDYVIIEWNDSNFDLSLCPLYVQQAYELQKWAFVTDYVRLKVVYENGGIYFDTDVELIKNIDELLCNNAFFGFEFGKFINTGLGFGSVKNMQLLSELMKSYEYISFISEEGVVDTLPCPIRNTEVFLRYGLIQNNTNQYLENGILILSSSYLSPIDPTTGELLLRDNTISIHWYDASWKSEDEKRQYKLIKKFNRIFGLKFGGFLYDICFIHIAKVCKTIKALFLNNKGF